jgi:integrase/recombinase XerD
MHLIWATSDFTIAGWPYPGFPIVLHDSMESAVEVNQFLRHYLTRGVIGSEQSWPSTGRALYDYFGFLEAHDLDWRDVARGEEKSLVAAYRDYCLTDLKMARNTVRQRLHYICAFYEYGLKQGWVGRLPFTLEDRAVRLQDKGSLAQTDTSGNRKTVRDVMPRHHKSLPKFLSKQQVKALLAATTNSHHLMMTRMALQTGLRREEIATFPLAYVFNPDARHGNGRNVRVSLDPFDGTGMKTKGNKARDIWISRRFMAELYRYSVLMRGERASLNLTDHQPLFLNQCGEPYASHGKQIEVIVRRNGVRTGIKVHPHMLRHTYATHTLVAMQRNRVAGPVEPLTFVQHQLGHVSIATTMVYLHLINELVDDAVLAYDDELNDWMEVA